VGSGEASRPFLRRFQIDEELCHVNRFRIGAVLRPASFGSHSTDDLRVVKDLSNFRCQMVRFADGNSRREIDVYPHRSFVQFGKEFSSELPQADNACGQQDDCKADNESSMRECPRKCWPIDPLAGPDSNVFLFRYIFSKEEVAK